MIKGKKLEGLLAEIDTHCSTHGISSLSLPFIPNISPYCGKVLKQLVLESKAKKILEVGTAVAYSTLWLASGLQEEGKVITIEIDAGMASKAREFIAKAKADSLISLIEGDALSVLPLLQQEKHSFDLVFLDAIKTSYLQYFHLSGPMLQKNGFLTAHNVFSFKQALAPFVQYIRSLEGFETKLIRQADLLVAKKTR